MVVEDTDTNFDKGALCIQKAGNQLGCSCIVIAKALMIYHHFQRVTTEIKYRDHTIAASILHTCIHLNTGRDRFKEVILVFHEYISEEMLDQESVFQPTDEQIMSMREDFETIQFFVMQTLEFYIDYVVAHSFAERYLRIIRDRPDFKDDWENFLHFVWKFISQFYLSKRCLQYSAQEIAFGSISLAAKALVLDLSVIPNWTEELAIHMDNKKQQDIFDDLLHVFDVLDV